MTPEQIAQKHDLKKRGNRWAGPCPQCGGSKASDKFVLRDDGGYKCHSCGIKGDAITWHRTYEGLSCPEAFEAIGKPCDRIDCSVRSTCRMGDGSSVPRPRVTSPHPVKKQSRTRTTEPKTPAQIWQTWADDMLKDGALELPHQSEIITWLKERGITRHQGKGWALGWNVKPLHILRPRIGLPAREDKPRLWVPAGLVIATLDEHGHVDRLRIRRTDEDRQQFLPDLKYVWIEGSGNTPMEIYPGGPDRGTLVVEAELDGIACALSHTDCRVFALGTVDMPLTADQQQRLQQSPVVLVALDADPGTLDKPGPGVKAFRDNWQSVRHARFWPVPAGKDPGEYVKDHQGNLHPWIEAGLAPSQRQDKRQKKRAGDEALPLIESAGGPGEREPVKYSEDVAIFGTSAGGQEYCVVKTRGQWRRMVAQYPGIAVVGERELQNIPPALAESVLAVKAVFGEAEVLEGLLL